MKWNHKMWMMPVAVAAMLLAGNNVARAQYGGGGMQQQSQQPPPPAPKPLSLDNAAPPPVNAEEDAAYKAFMDSPPGDFQKKIDLGEAFAQKYPKSRYLVSVYSLLANAYLFTGHADKMEEVGDKAIELNPNDVQVLASLGQTIPRVIGSKPPADRAKELDKAERYAKRALEVTATMPKPDNLTQESFDSAKNTVIAMAHSGLGLVYVHEQKYSEAIAELDSCVKVDPNPDPVNYYLLGLANLKGSHFDDAVAAYTKCASLPGQMQPTCQKGAEEAKKLASTQLSAPK